MELFDGIVSQLQRETVTLQSQITADAVDSRNLLSYMTKATDRLVDLDRITNIGSIDTFAREFYDDNTYNLTQAANFPAFRTALVAVRDWVVNNFPTAGGFNLDTQTIGGRAVVRILSGTEITGLSTVVGALIAEFEA